MTAAQTTTYRITSETQGCRDATATFTRTVADGSESPSPRPTVTPHSDPACPSVTVQQPAAITSGHALDIVVAVESPSATNTVTLFREDPAPRTTMREVQTSGRRTATTFTVRLGESHRFRAVASYGGSCLGGQQSEFFVPVRAAVTLTARRNATRNYTFTGRVQPAYGTLTSTGWPLGVSPLAAGC